MRVEFFASKILTKNIPQWGWEDECIVDCPYNGNCSNNCAMHFLNEEYEQ